MTVPGKRHKAVGDDQQEDGVNCFHFLRNLTAKDKTAISDFDFLLSENYSEISTAYIRPYNS